MFSKESLVTYKEIKFLGKELIIINKERIGIDKEIK